MNIDLKFLEPYLIYMIFAFLGLLILYIKTYTTEKAKMEVLKSENKKLIEETERIKKDFQLEISKRRYQYESKNCLLYTSPSPRDTERSRMPSSA